MVTKKAANSKQSQVKEQSENTDQTASSAKINGKTNSKASDQAHAGSESQDDSKSVEDLASLTETLEDGLTDINPDSALKMIDQWHSLIQKSKEPEMKGIATSLKDLQKTLKRDDATGHDLGEILSHLGEQTSEIASKAKQGLKTPLQHLGKQLTKAGRSLAKEEDQQQIEALGSLVEVLNQDEIDSKSASEIDQWYDLLHASEDENLQAIAGELKELKQLLKGKKVNPDELSDMLINIGELTTEASSNASRGFKGAVQMIGKALTRLGESVE
jgi:hypothetical protein